MRLPESRLPRFRIGDFIQRVDMPMQLALQIRITAGRGPPCGQEDRRLNQSRVETERHFAHYLIMISG